MFSDEYTKITTPRQDMLFKKGYLGRKKSTPTPSQDTGDTQSAGKHFFSYRNFALNYMFEFKKEWTI